MLYAVTKFNKVVAKDEHAKDRVMPLTGYMLLVFCAYAYVRTCDLCIACIVRCASFRHFCMWYAGVKYIYVCALRAYSISVYT